MMNLLQIFMGLIPLGMSGLKLLYGYSEFECNQAHPAWDEWIEITLEALRSSRLTGLIPLGMSGLKYRARKE